MELDLEFVGAPDFILSTPGVPIEFTLRVTNLGTEANTDPLWYMAFALIEIALDRDGSIIAGDKKCKSWIPVRGGLMWETHMLSTRSAGFANLNVNDPAAT